MAAKWLQDKVALSTTSTYPNNMAAPFDSNKWLFYLCHYHIIASTQRDLFFSKLLL
jgi:hypothetical protein